MTEDEKALVVALVRAQIMGDISNMSWVLPYTKVRWANKSEACVAEYVGGHWRRKAHCKRTIDALACVCKQPVLGEAEAHMPPVGRKRHRTPSEVVRRYAGEINGVRVFI